MLDPESDEALLDACSPSSADVALLAAGSASSVDCALK